MNYKGFHQLQWEDRLVIEKMLQVGVSKAKIAQALGVCRKTIYNEIKRGWTLQLTSDYRYIWRYCPETAERKYRAHLRAKGPNLKIGNDHAFARYVEHKIIQERYSPAAVLAELRKAPLAPHFCTATTLRVARDEEQQEARRTCFYTIGLESLCNIFFFTISSPLFQFFRVILLFSIAFFFSVRYNIIAHFSAPFITPPGVFIAGWGFLVSYIRGAAALHLISFYSLVQHVL